MVGPVDSQKKPNLQKKSTNLVTEIIGRVSKAMLIV